MSHVTKTSFYALILISYKKILGSLARNTARDFTKIFSQWKSISGLLGQRNDGRLHVVFDKGRYVWS